MKGSRIRVVKLLLQKNLTEVLGFGIFAALLQLLGQFFNVRYALYDGEMIRSWLVGVNSNLFQTSYVPKIRIHTFSANTDYS